MKMPCDECLKYVICRSKETVGCDDLNWFFNQTRYEMRQIEIARVAREGLKARVAYLQDETWDQAWAVVRKHLPNINGIYNDTL